MYQGSCCCGEVRFSIAEKPKMIGACYCSRCRKLGSTPFAMVHAEGFALLSGKERIVEYHPEPPFKYTRTFCGKCGTSLGEITSKGSLFPIPVNCFDQEFGMPIRFHEHVATKPSWHHIPEGEKQFPGDPS